MILLFLSFTIRVWKDSIFGIWIDVNVGRRKEGRSETSIPWSQRSIKKVDTKSQTVVNRERRGWGIQGV